MTDKGPAADSDDRPVTAGDLRIFCEELFVPVDGVRRALEYIGTLMYQQMLAEISPKLALQVINDHDPDEMVVRRVLESILKDTPVPPWSEVETEEHDGQ